MTLSTFTESISETTDALFRTAILKYDTAIKAVGLVQTSDTGQINFSTVTKPAVVNTKAGYAIYRFDDSLQASYPCYIRVDYGVGDSTSTHSLWVTVGLSTDGAGTLGTASPIVQFRPYNLTAYISGCSGSTSRLTIVCTPGTQSNAYSAILSIERLQDVNGADTNTGLVFTWVKNFSGTNSFQYSGQQVLYFGGGSQPVATYSATGSLPVLSYTGTSVVTWANGKDVYLPLVYPVGRTVHYPIQGIIGYLNTDLPGTTVGNSVQVPISHYGTTRTWIYSSQMINIVGTNVNILPMARWD